MSRIDFDKFLNKKYNGDYKEVLNEYKYDRGELIFKRIKDVEKQNYNELNDIANMIVLWKINRTPHIDDKKTFDELLNIKNIKNKESALKEQEKIKSVLELLLNSKGVRLAMASTFLHFFNEKCFPIFDQRAYRVIFNEDYVSSNSVGKQINFYIKYLEGCIDYYNRKKLNEQNIDFADIDKLLYQLDKAIGNKVKNYGRTK